MRPEMKYGVIIALSLVVSSCSWLSKKDDAKPAELKPIKEEVQLKRVWDYSVGHKARDRASKLIPVLAGGRIFAASADGTVVAMQPENGKVIWEKRVQDFYPEDARGAAFAKKSDAITGGVGAGKDIILVGTFAGDVIAMNQSDGSLAWRSRATSEILAPPQGHGDLVVAQTADGKVSAYNALDGTRLWVYSSNIPSLTLRGTSTPIVTDSYVFAAFASGRVVAIDRDKGIAKIDQRVAVSEGKSDLERLIDIDGDMAIDNGGLYVASYQGNVMAVDIESGSVLWSKAASSTAGVAAGFNNVYLAAFDGTLTAFDERTGRKIWDTEALKNRQLTTPATISSYVAVGDFDGYIHLLAQSDGRFVGRVRVEDGPLTAPFVVSNTRLYVQTRGGDLYAYDLHQGT